MATVGDIYVSLDKRAPFDTQMSFDNAGLLVGSRERAVGRILVALDITEEVAEEAHSLDCELIVAHHPVIFDPLRTITDENPTGRTIMRLVEWHISTICAHTNLDLAQGGVNDALAEALELRDFLPLSPDGLGRVGNAAGERSLMDFAAFVNGALKANGVRFVDAGKPVRHVAVGGGACADLMERTLALGCDTFVTSDVKYNGFLDAKAMGLNLIDAGHFPTENVVCPVLVDWLKEDFPEARIFLSKCHREVFSYL